VGHAEWLRFGLRDRLLRSAHDPDTCAPEEFVVPFFGGSYRGDFSTFIDWSVFYYGAYAREELRLIEDVLGAIDSPVAIDVGANVGHHTLFMALHAQRVIAFEPFAAVAAALKRKVADNGLENVAVLDCALGDRNMTATYFKPIGHNTGTGGFVAPGDGRDTVQLPIRIGDEVLAETGVDRVHFIKIDTEGFEAFVLRGLRQTLSRCRPIVLFEWTGGRDGSPSALFPERYRVLAFLPDVNVLGVFREHAYSVRPLTDDSFDGYLLAVPEESLELHRRLNRPRTQKS
jgi:FkbM family methyltransferase